MSTSTAGLRRAPLRRLADRAGVPTSPGQLRFVLLVLIDAVGTGMFMPITVLFFTRSAGLSAIAVGTGLSLSGVAGLVVAPVGGRLLDRYDARSVLLPTLVVRAGCYAAYGTVHSVAVFLPLICLVGAAAQTGRPARNVLATNLAESTELVRLLAFMTSCRNVGFGLGGLLASVALATHSRAGFLAVIWLNALSYLVAAALLPGVAPARAAAARPAARGPRAAVLRDGPYVALTALNAVIVLHESVLVVGLPLWLSRATGAPTALLGILSTLNTVLVVGLQVWASRGAETVPGAARAYVRSGVAFAFACLLFGFADRPGAVAASVLLTLAVVALTGGEMWSSAGEWGVSIGLAPEHARGQYLSLYSMGLGLEKVVGPLLVAVVVVDAGRAGWLLLAAAVLAAGTASAVIATRAHATRAVGEPVVSP